MSKQLDIKSIDIYPLDVPLIAPFNTAVSSHTLVNNVAIQVKLADGAIGWGETPTLPPLTLYWAGMQMSGGILQQSYLNVCQNPLQYVADLKWP